MKCILTITTSLLLLMLVTRCDRPSVCAQGAGIEWEILNQEVIGLTRGGEYDRGVVVAKKALEVAEKNVGPNHPDVATSLNNLAELYRNQGLYAQAEPLYRRALAIREKALGLDHPSLATSLNNLATLYDDLAVLACDRSPRAALYDDQGLYAQAEPLYRRALVIREKALGPDHPDVATSLENLAGLYRATERDEEAKTLEKRAARIQAIQR